MMARCVEAPSTWKAWLFALLLTTACFEERPDPNQTGLSGPAASDTSKAAAGGREAVLPPCGNGNERGAAEPPCPPPSAAAEPNCENPLPIFTEGAEDGAICPDQAASRGLTIVDLSPDWAPAVLAGDANEGAVPYRDVYLKLAAGKIDTGPRWDRARLDQFFELYGIFPTLGVVAVRLADAKRHECHAGVDNAALEALDRGINTWDPVAKQQGDLATLRPLRKRLDTAVKALKLDSIDELSKHRRFKGYLKRYRQLKGRIDAIKALQKHLRCEGLLDQAFEGVMSRSTIEGLQLYHRRHMIVSWQLGPKTAARLISDSRELDFLTLLRVLRERVIAATGILEDGSAAGVSGKVAGRTIDTDVFLTTPAGPKPKRAAPDRVSAATDAAAKALGWTEPQAALTFLQEHSKLKRVALKLPERPAYHRSHMALRVEIDRGDLWYDFPFTNNGDRRLQQLEREASLVVYARDGDGEIALVRWPTTIGGWQPERLGNGQVKLVYKESPAGSRVMRDVVAAPRWIPPRSTPERDLMRPRGGGLWAPRYDTFGPDYASAYGLVMMVHHRVDKDSKGGVLFTDQGIRSHGSVSYASILDGFSHGCHRLHNHRAVRLSGFLLAHRKHQVRGPIELGYSRHLHWRQKNYRLSFQSRGFRYELTPPVSVEVLQGNVKGHSWGPLPPRNLTRPMIKRYQ